MKLKFFYILLLILPVLLFAQQASSSNYKLVDYGLFNGNLADSDVPASTNYKAELNTLGGLSDEEIASANYKNYAGYYLGPLTSEILPPENVTITVVDDIIKILWSAVGGATSYKVFSSDNPYDSFTEDTSGGTFVGASWSASVGETKKFYYVTAVE